MKKTAIFILMILLLFLISCSSEKAKDKNNSIQETSERSEDISSGCFPDWTVSYLDNYHDLYIALTDKDSDTHQQLIESGKYRTENSKEFVPMLLKFETGEYNLMIPALDNVPIPQSDRRGFQNVVFGSERYKLPWIWTYCDYKDEELYVCLCYSELLQNEDSPKTISEVKNKNIYNEIKNRTIIDLVLADEKKYDCIFYKETDEYERGHYIFIYKGMFVHIFCNHAAEILTDDFWSRLSFVPYENK